MSFPRFNFPNKLGVHRLFAYLAFSIALGWIVPLSDAYARKAKRNARQEFNLARQYFERGQLQDSVKILKRLLKRYPKNKAAYHLLGRIYYRGGRVKAAAKFFGKSGGEFLYTGGSFEYGIAMFSVGRCAKAMDGFKRVSSSSSLKDLARFYSGVCHYRARRWYPAESELLRARRLPANLIATRQRFLQEIQKKKQEERLGQFAQANPYQPVPIPYAGQASFATPAGIPGLPAGPGAPTPEELQDPEAGAEGETKKKAKPEAPQIKTGLSWNITPLAEYQNKSQTFQRHQASTKTVVTTGPRAEGNLQSRYDFAPDANGRQMALTGNFKIDYQQFEVSKKDVAVEIDTEGEKTETATGANESDRKVTFEVKPALSVPFGQTVSLEGGGTYREIWPDMEPEKKIVESGPFANASFVAYTLNLNASGELLQKEKLNDENLVVNAQDTSFSLGVNGPLPLYELSFNLGANFTQTDNVEYASLDGFESSQTFSGGVTKAWETVTIAATVAQTINAPPAETVVSGTADELKAVAELTKTLKIGATVKLSGEFAQINQYNKSGLCPVDEQGFFDPDCDEGEQQTAVAVGERTGFGVSLKIAPVDWAYASAAYDYDSTVFTVQQKELVPAFQAAVSDQVETITLLIGISYTF